jgi:hypothetical protein
MPPPSRSLSNFGHKSAPRTALNVKLTPPLVAGASIQYTKGTKAKKGFEVMITPESRQKSHSAEIAHMNDLLDEALKETFPASDPIAIGFEFESPEHEIATTPGFHTPLRGALRRGRGSGDGRPRRA